MNIELVHPFWKKYSDALELFKGNSEFGSWVSRVTRISKKIEKDPRSIPFSSNRTNAIEIANQFRGDSFEGFGEIFLKLMGFNPLVGVYNYEPTPIDDYGIDGNGLGINGKLLTVQFKFRSEFDKTLTEEKDHLGNFLNASFELGVDINDDFNMLILTTGKRVFYKDVAIKWKNKVRYIASNESWGCFKNQKYIPQNPTNIFSFKTLLDGNLPFWNTAITLIKDTA